MPAISHTSDELASSHTSHELAISHTSRISHAGHWPAIGHASDRPAVGHASHQSYQLYQPCEAAQNTAESIQELAGEYKSMQFLLLEWFVLATRMDLDGTLQTVQVVREGHISGILLQESGTGLREPFEENRGLESRRCPCETVLSHWLL
jgi:hypothetical protein